MAPFRGAMLVLSASTAAVAGSCSATGECSTTYSGVLLQLDKERARLRSDLVESIRGGDSTCDEGAWPDLDHGLVCGACKVLVNHFSSLYKNCDGYCGDMGRVCVGAWEERDDTCDVLFTMTCDQQIDSSDAICECGAARTGDDPPSGETCESQLGNNACRGSECATCGDRIAWLKANMGMLESAARQHVADEFPSICGACGGSGSPSPPSPPAPAPTPSSGGSIQIRVVSYNLYWWNAFRDNSWKSQGIVDNIKNTLQPDTLGMQECDDPGQIQSRAGGYSAASPYEGAQGVSVKPGVFSVEASGSRNLQATGHWGPRHVTWAKLRHSASGRSFWHFNTHWCVRDCDQWKRYSGAQTMVSTIQEMAGGEPVVVTGDFNAGQGEPGIQHFLQNGFAIAEWNWVDSVLYSTSHWTRVGHWVGDTAGSDHRPIVADLRLN